MSFLRVLPLDIEGMRAPRQRSPFSELLQSISLFCPSRCPRIPPCSHHGPLPCHAQVQTSPPLPSVLSSPRLAHPPSGSPSLQSTWYPRGALWNALLRLHASLLFSQQPCFLIRHGFQINLYSADHMLNRGLRLLVLLTSITSLAGFVIVWVFIPASSVAVGPLRGRDRRGDEDAEGARTEARYALDSDDESEGQRTPTIYAAIPTTTLEDFLGSPGRVDPMNEVCYFPAPRPGTDRSTQRIPPTPATSCSEILINHALTSLACGGPPAGKTTVGRGWGEGGRDVRRGRGIGGAGDLGQ